MEQNQIQAALMQAYLHALPRSVQPEVARDPVKNVFFNEPVNFDHQNTFGFLQSADYGRSNVSAKNIRNAATLYAIMIIGDEMGVFRVADAILKYVTMGFIDVESNATSTRVYNYMKLREHRTTAEERAMFYKQVFNLGNGQTPEGMPTNRNFWPLMESLFHHTKEYLSKYELSDSPSKISQAALRQLIKDLQHNLSRAASGMVKLYVPEIYAHLEDAIQIIDAPEIKDQLGMGMGRELWNVVEQVSMEEFGYYPNTSALRTVAVAAREVMNDIASYTDGSFDNNDFQNFMQHVEALIIAQNLLELRQDKPQQRMAKRSEVFQGLSSGAPKTNGFVASNGHSNGYEEPEIVEDDWNF
ncbi:MAG: hypothetical protein AAFY71_18345 [Bacteroidota bacterium]